MSTADAYVTALDRRLVGPRRVRRGLVQEARDHLDDAAAAHCRAGRDREDSERLAVDEFGSLEEIAPAFQTTLAVASARRTARMLLGVLAIQPFLWDGPLGPDDPQPDGPAFAVLDAVVEWGGFLMLTLAVSLVIATGLGNRWFAAGRGVARLTSVAAIGIAVVLELIGVAMTLLGASTNHLAWLMLTAFLIVPLSLTAAAARRTLAAC